MTAITSETPTMHRLLIERQQLAEENDRLKAQNAALAAALEDVLASTHRGDFFERQGPNCPVKRARAALAKSQPDATMTPQGSQTFATEGGTNQGSKGATS